MAPVQKRALLTREKILDALQALLKTEEFERISIADIARQGGVAVGSVYSHFKDKEALLPALLERRFDQAEAHVEAVHRDANAPAEFLPDPIQNDLKTTLNALLVMARQRVREDRGMLRALLTYRRLYPEKDDPRRSALTAQGVAAIQAALEPYRDEIQTKDAEAVARLVYYFVSVSYLDEAVFSPTPSVKAVTPSDEEKLEAYTQMLYLYLTT